MAAENCQITSNLNSNNSHYLYMELDDSNEVFSLILKISDKFDKMNDYK